MGIATIDDANKWRLETPGHEGWKRTARPDAPNRYLMISCDCHANEPANLWNERLDEKYRSRLPRIEADENGVKWMVSDGMRRSRLQESIFEGEDLIRTRTGANVAERRTDDLRDGVDAEIIFPNKGLFMWATPDPQFAQAQCRVWNDWAWETYGPCNEQMSPMAALATADIEGSLVEIERVAKLGFRGVTMPCKPVWNSQDARDPNYNMRIYDRMWQLIQETGLPVTFHIGTGRDPREASKEGGAVINYVAHALVQAIEPVTALCASGVLERFPGIRFAAIRVGDSDGFRGRSPRWTRDTSSITCGRSPSSRCCRASIFAHTAPSRSRKTAPGWRSRCSSILSTTFCGRTTIRIMRVHGRIRLRPLSVRWDN